MTSPHITLSNQLCIFCQQRPETGENVAIGISPQFGFHCLKFSTYSEPVLAFLDSRGYTSTFTMPAIGQEHIRRQDVYIDTETRNWMLCLMPDCIRCASSPRSILYHSACYKAFKVLWKRSDLELLPSSLTAVHELGSSLTPWFAPTGKHRIYSNTSAAFLWWSRRLDEMTALSTGPTELSVTVALLCALPLELLGLILVAGGRDLYRSALFRHVLVAQVSNVVSAQKQNLRDESAQVCKPDVEFLNNQYATVKNTTGVVEQLGVDHLGVRSNSDDCPWYIKKKDVKLCYKAGLPGVSS
jgi:hypothetical protein